MAKVLQFKTGGGVDLRGFISDYESGLIDNAILVYEKNGESMMRILTDTPYPYLEGLLWNAIMALSFECLDPDSGEF